MSITQKDYDEVTMKDKIAELSSKIDSIWEAIDSYNAETHEEFAHMYEKAFERMDGVAREAINLLENNINRSNFWTS